MEQLSYEWRGFNIPYRLCMFVIHIWNYLCMFDVNDVKWLYLVVKVISNSK